MAPVQAGKKSFIGSPTVKLSKGTGSDLSIARTAQLMADTCGERSLLIDVEMQQQQKPLGVALVNPNVGHIYGIVTTNNSNNKIII